MRRLFALLAFLCFASSAHAVTIRVDSVVALNAAYKAAACGDHIEMGPGLYEKWRPGAITRDCGTNPVIITAADPNAMPTFAGLTMDSMKGVTFRAVRCDITRGVASFAACMLSNGISSNITIEDSEIFGLSDPTTVPCKIDAVKCPTGTTVELEGIGYGVSGKFTDLVVRRNNFHDLSKGVVLGDSDRVKITYNDFTNITVDGFVFGGLQDGEISYNLIVKKALPDASTAHPDCGQGLLGARASLRVILIGNLCVGNPTGKGTQGLFVADDPRYDLIQITGNALTDTGYRSLSAMGLKVDITDNVAVSQRTDSSSRLYWTATTGVANGNTVNLVVSAPPGAVNTTVPRATAAEIDAVKAGWMSKYRAKDPRDILIAELRAKLAETEAALAASRAATTLALSQRDAAAAKVRAGQAVLADPIY